MTSRIDYNDPHGEGELSLAYHYEMVSDAVRVAPFKKAIQKVSKGKIVLESGPGTGIMSIIAARAGAKHVYAFELDPKIAAFAQENFNKSAKDKVTLLQRNTLTVEKSDIENNSGEVIIAENLSTWFVTEPQIQIMNHINQKLAAPNAIHLPQTVDNSLELTYTNYLFENVVELRAHYFQFTGIKAPEILSEKIIFEKVDLGQVNPESYEKTVTVEVTKNGVVNGLRLTSPLAVYQDITFDASDSLMPAVVVPLPGDVSVSKGDKLEVTIKYDTNTTWEKFQCSAKVR